MFITSKLENEVIKKWVEPPCLNKFIYPSMSIIISQDGKSSKS